MSLKINFLKQCACEDLYVDKYELFKGKKMLSFTRRWLYEVSYCMTSGRDISPRNKSTREVLGRVIEFNMRNPILDIPERELGTAFLTFEPYWVLSGDNRLETIKPYAPVMERFSDDDMFLSGAYGPKIVDQLPYVIMCLEKDDSSRQAVINIWREKPYSTKDCPCTCLYQFTIRGGELNMQVYMRSNDMYLGTPYDVFTQTMVAYAICLLYRKKTGVKITLGNLSLHVGSLHIYSENFDKIEEILTKHVGRIVGNCREPGKYIDYDYTMSFDDLKEYLKHCSKNLINGLQVGDGFLKGLQPKGVGHVFR